MKKLLTLLLVITLNFVTWSVWADTLEMKDGRLLQGTYMGGTQQTVRFQVDKTVVVYPIKDILAITFSNVTFTSQETATPLPKIQTPQPKLQAVTIASGTRLPVRMKDSLDVNVNKQGDWFNAILDEDLVVNGDVVIPGGTEIHGQVVRAEQGRYGSSLMITLEELVLKEQLIPIITTNYVAEEKAQKLFDVGSLKIVTRNRSLQIPYQTLVEFELREPVKIDVLR